MHVMILVRLNFEMFYVGVSIGTLTLLVQIGNLESSNFPT